MLIFRDGASQRAQRTFLATGSVKLSGLFTTQWQKIFSALPESCVSKKSTWRSSRTRKKIRSFLSKNFLQIFSVFTEKISKENLPLSARSEMLIFFSRRRLSASAENISCHWVCEIIRVIHDPVARNVLCAPCESCVSKKSTWEEGSRTRKKIRSFLSKNFLQDFFRIHGKNFERKLTP